METKKMKARSGEMITLDISDGACLPFGFKSGTRVLDPDNDEVTIMGVAKGTSDGCGGSDKNIDVMWFQPKGKNYIMYYDSSKNLKNEGFKEIKK